MAGTRLGLKTITFACDEITLFLPVEIELLEIEGKNNKDFILDILDRDNLIEDFKKIINE